MKKIYYLLITVFMLSSNLFAQRSASTVNVNVATNPSGAYFITGTDNVNKFGPTPVTIPLIKNRTYDITFTKEGYKTKTINFKAGSGDINETLEPLASSAQINYNLSVSSNVTGADVYINNQLYGKTPLNVSLPSANYNVTVKLSGYTDFVSNITLNSNQNINANFTPNSYNLSVSSNIAGADVYVNNQLYGKTPLNISLPSANYNVTVKLTGYTDYVSNIALNSNQNINANFVPNSYTLSVSSNIAGADVYINDQLYGKTPLSISLPPATYKITAKYAGYVDFVSNVNLSSNQNVTASFTPIKYTLSVVSNIRGADVYIGGQLKGKTPLNISLPQASYEVVVKMARYKDFIANVNLTNNQSLSANLVQDVYVLSVSSSVTGADVYIGGQLKGKTPLNISLQPAAYSVTVKLEGYLDYTANVNLTSSQNIIALLNPLKYIILSLPVGTKLWLNGKTYQLNFGNIKDDNKFDNVKTDIDDKKEKYKEFKIYSETNKTDLIEIRYKNLVTGPMNIEFNNKIKELRLSLFDK